MDCSLDTPYNRLMRVLTECEKLCSHGLPLEGIDLIADQNQVETSELVSELQMSGKYKIVDGVMRC